MRNVTKKEWVEALRSGKYAQGKAALKYKTGEHCCLGVLCDLADPEGWVEAEAKDSRANLYAWREPKRTGYPGQDIASLSDITGVDLYDLAELNDNGATFEQIASIIESPHLRDEVWATIFPTGIDDA